MTVTFVVVEVEGENRKITWVCGPGLTYEKPEDYYQVFKEHRPRLKIHAEVALEISDREAPLWEAMVALHRLTEPPHGLDMLLRNMLGTVFEADQKHGNKS